MLSELVMFKKYPWLIVIEKLKLVMDLSKIISKKIPLYWFLWGTTFYLLLILTFSYLVLKNDLFGDELLAV